MSGFTFLLVLMTYAIHTSQAQTGTTFSPQGGSGGATVPPGTCNNTWISMPNMNVVGGSYYSPAQTALDCQAACVGVANCTGVDFDGANRCWFIYSNSTPQNSSGYVSHYQLIRGLNSCTGPSCSSGQPAAWSLTPNSHVIGGTSTNDTSIVACLQRCSVTTACTGFDWDGTCWICTNTNPPQLAAGVNHFDKLCYSQGFQVVTANNIPPALQGGSLGVTFSTPPTAASTTLVTIPTTTNTATVPSSSLVPQGSQGQGGQGSLTSPSVTSLVPGSPQGQGPTSSSSRTSSAFCLVLLVHFTVKFFSL